MNQKEYFTRGMKNNIDTIKEKLEVLEHAISMNDLNSITFNVQGIIQASLNIKDLEAYNYGYINAIAVKNSKNKENKNEN